MRVAIIAVLGIAGGCSGLTHFEEYQSGGDGGSAMDATPPRDAPLGDCPPIGESCNGRDDDCDGVIDGPDADATCTAGIHATGSCVDGACAYTCEMGWGDCDEMESDCEADLGAPATCRSCDASCSGDTPLCSATGCTATCPAGQMECGGACVNTATDTEHCGGCLMPCMIPNGTPRCTASVCGVLACDALWADCNRSATDGCEERLDTVENCGGCGTACAPDHATASCLGGTCMVVTCESGWRDCNSVASDGCETDLSDVRDCGGCGDECPAAGAHADVECDPATFDCVYTCDDPRYDDCDGTEESCETDLSMNGNCGRCGESCTAPSTCLSLGGGAYGCSGTEICGNGMDDDSDSLIDCADTADCMATHVCVPPVPPGWTGPLQLYDGPRTSAPSCDGAFPTNVYDGFDGLMPNSHSCSSCSCSPPSGVSCRGPSVTAWLNEGSPMVMRDGSIGIGDAGSGAGDGSTGGGCSGCAQTFPTGGCTGYGGGMCVAGGDIISSFGVDIGTSMASGGTCTPSGGSPTTSSPTWSDLGRACQPSGGGGVGGCMAGTTCWPRPTGMPWLPKYCVQHTGAMVCPAGPYTMQHVFYADFNDTRGCSTCMCGGAAGSSCTGSVAFYGGGTGMCSTDYVGTYGTSDPCRVIPRTFFQHQFVGGSSFSGGSCVQSGGSVTGSVMPVTPTTFCCIP